MSLDVATDYSAEDCVLQVAVVGLITTFMCSIVVVHCAVLPIKKYYGHLQLRPIVSFAGTNLGY